MENKFCAEKLKADVHDTFENLRKALHVREKLLLRQIDVFDKTSNKKISEIKFMHENNEMEQMLSSIRTFGKFNIDYLNIMKNEVYQNENEVDHEHEMTTKSFNQDENPEKQEVIVSLKANKLKQNVDLFNESIINLTLNESKNLINLNALLADNNLNEENIDLTSEKSKQSKHIKNSQATETTTKPKKNSCSKVNSCKKEKSLKNISNLTLNGITGTLNLKNISNLTINSCDNSKITSPEEQPSPKMANCDFYKRLITENKLLKNHIRNELTKTQNFPSKNVEFIHQNYSSLSSSSSACMSPCSPNDFGSKFNEEHLKKIFITKEINIPLQPITIELKHSANKKTGLEHPVQVQQWLKQIIYETETEPQQSQELLEFSQIH